MTIVIWLLLGLAYLWSVRNLFRMTRWSDPGCASISSEAAQIDLVGAEEDRRGVVFDRAEEGWKGTVSPVEHRS